MSDTDVSKVAQDSNNAPSLIEMQTIVSDQPQQNEANPTINDEKAVVEAKRFGEVQAAEAQAETGIELENAVVKAQEDTDVTKFEEIQAAEAQAENGIELKSEVAEAQEETEVTKFGEIQAAEARAGTGIELEKAALEAQEETEVTKFGEIQAAEVQAETGIELEKSIVDAEAASEVDKFADVQEAETGIERGGWSGKLDFFFVMLGGAVGLGNIWRFPYLCYKNGGGAFLIPYVLMGLVIGIPLFLMESSFGQFSSLGPIKIWRVSPLFKGLGYAMVMILWTIGTYYNVTLAQIMFYLFASMTSELPWATCNNTWNTANCYCAVCPVPPNTTVTIPENARTPAEEYYERAVIQLTSGIDDLGYIQWQLCLCLLLVWTIVVLVLLRGAASLGKVVYFVALFPYVMMTIMLIQSLQLPGSGSGLLYFITPRWELIAQPRVWADAASQMFFSISTCDGGLIAMSSYNQFKNNVFRDSFLLVIVDMMTSIYCGAVVFSILGYIAEKKNVSIDDVARSGPGLAFEVYPEALATMYPATLWSILFFIMMAVLGFGTAFSISEGVIVALSDEMKSVVLKTKWRNIAFRVSICTFTFLISLPMVTQGGMYILTIVDNYIGTFPMLFTGLGEIIILQYIYGFNRFSNDVYFMIGIRPNWVVRIFWQISSPLIIILILIANFALYEEVTYNGYVYPSWATALGFVIMCAPLSMIPLYGFYYYCYRLAGWRLAKEAATPELGWGPSLKSNYKLYIEELPDKYKHFQTIEGTVEAYSATMLKQVQKPLLGSGNKVAPMTILTDSVDESIKVTEE